MTLQWIGAIMILSACGGFGLHIAASHRRSVQTFLQLQRSLDLMDCALQYQLTPLPVLCEQAGRTSSGKVKLVFLELATQLRRQTHHDPPAAMDQVLRNPGRDLSPAEYKIFKRLGESLGRFDLSGQIKGIQSLREECSQQIVSMKENQEERLRGYQTLGFCAGAALVILFI